MPLFDPFNQPTPPARPNRPAPVLTPEQVKQRAIDRAIFRHNAMVAGAARVLKDAYTGIRADVYSSEDFTSDEYYACVAEKGGVEAVERIATFARIAKGVANTVKPGVIEDDVPAAVITLAGGE